MDDFCWLTGPDLCGRLTFDLPVIEVLAITLVSGVVAWATIYFSLRHARLQTDRAIYDARRRELHPTVKELANIVQEAFDDKDTSFGQVQNWQVGIFQLANSGLPYSREAALWLFNYSYVAIAQAKNPNIVPPDIFRFDPSGPSTLIILELGAWLSKPDVHGILLSNASENLNEWVEAGGLKPQPDDQE